MFLFTICIDLCFFARQWHLQTTFCQQRMSHVWVWVDICSINLFDWSDKIFCFIANRLLTCFFIGRDMNVASHFLRWWLSLNFLVTSFSFQKVHSTINFSHALKTRIWLLRPWTIKAFFANENSPYYNSRTILNTSKFFGFFKIFLILHCAASIMK